MAALIEQKDKAVLKAISNMYGDFKNSVVKNQDSIAFENMLEQVKNNKKITLMNASTLYQYVYDCLNTKEESSYSAAKSISPSLNFTDYLESQIILSREWALIKKWLEVNFDTTIYNTGFISVSCKSEEALIEEYENSEQYIIDSLKEVELQENGEAEQKNQEAISHPDYPSEDYS